MIFTDSKTNAILAMFISGYEYYPDKNSYDKEWLEMSFCYHDDKNRRYVIGKDACIWASDDELRSFASMFRIAITQMRVGQVNSYCPTEQNPRITITKPSEYAWQIQVDVHLPTGFRGGQYEKYTVIDTHVTEWQLYQYADSFTDMAMEWTGNGKHFVPKERMPEEAISIQHK